MHALQGNVNNNNVIVVDNEEHVITRCVHSIASLVELKLFSRSSLLKIMPRVMPLLGHPNFLLRNGKQFYI